MKNKSIVKIISLISVAVILVGIFIIPTHFRTEVQAYTENIDTTISEILLWKYDGTIQELLDNEIAKDMGNNASAWYAIALSRYQEDLDFSSCIQALDSYTTTAQRIKPTDRQRIAIAYLSMGVSNDFVMTALQETIGELGIMSYVYGLILADCGAYYTDLSCSRETILETLLSLQNADGGWALTGTVSDVDVTAMTVQALARYYDYERVKTVVDKALNLLSQRQQADGDFQSYGTANAESTAQVMLALNVLNIDYQTDKRFIKNGKTVYDGIMKYQQTDGGFAHTMGTKSNALATAEALCAIVSMKRYETNQLSFYAFTDRTISLSWTKVSEASCIETSHTESSLPQEHTQSSVISSEVSQKESVSEQDTVVSVEQSLAETSSELFIEEASVSESAEPEEIVSESSAENSHVTSATSSFQTEKETTDAYAVDGRLFVCIGAVGLLGIVLAVMVFKKKANRKNILVWVVLFVGVQIIVWTVNIQTKEDYYAVQESKSTVQTVTLSIICSNAFGQTDNAYLPADGVILEPTEIGFDVGNTVFDVLLMVVKEREIQLDYTGNGDSFVYIRGIGYLYEFDCGELSGWIYRVNGEQPSVGCSSYVLQDGDVIEWIYTCNLGKDITE